MKRQLVGVFAEDWLTPYAEALRALGSERAMVVHGRDGLDELTTTDITYVAILDDGVITRREIAPEDAGLDAAPASPISKAAMPTENAAALTALLEGEGRAAYRDIVLLNAGAA